MKQQTKSLTRLALITALYVVLSLVVAPFSFGPVQVRLGEILNLLVVFDKRIIYALALGCAIVNMFSPLGIVDVVVGTLSTIVSLTLTYWLTKRVASIPKKLGIATVVVTLMMWPVALELFALSHMPFWATYVSVMIGECIALLVGDVLFYFIAKKKR